MALPARDAEADEHETPAPAADGLPEGWGAFVAQLRRRA